MIVEFLKAVLFGIIEGITEWLPVSSTGHLILLGDRLSLGVTGELGAEFEDMFNFVIQLGAILAVLILYRKRFYILGHGKSREERREMLSLAGKIVLASIPAAVVGTLGDRLVEGLTGKDIDGHFYNSMTVAIMLVAYGVLFIVAERLDKKRSSQSLEESTISTGRAFAVGCFQALSVIPGTSRSGATMLGARLLGVDRGSAAEFSFFLGVPAIAGASIIKAMDFAEYVAANKLHVPLQAYALLLAATVTSFVVSVLTIKALVGFVRKHSFAPFGVYRIILGIVVIASSWGK